MKKLSILLVVLLLCMPLAAQEVNRDIKDLYLEALIEELIDVMYQTWSMAMDLVDDVNGSYEGRYTFEQILGYQQNRIDGLMAANDRLHIYLQEVCRTLGYSYAEMRERVDEGYAYFLLEGY